MGYAYRRQARSRLSMPDRRSPSTFSAIPRLDCANVPALSVASSREARCTTTYARRGCLCQHVSARYNWLTVECCRACRISTIYPNPDPATASTHNELQFNNQSGLSSVVWLIRTLNLIDSLVINQSIKLSSENLIVQIFIERSSIEVVKKISHMSLQSLCWLAASQTPEMLRQSPPRVGGCSE
jgi:hypothetical protein